MNVFRRRLRAYEWFLYAHRAAATMFPACVLAGVLACSVASGNWPQAAGPHLNWKTEGSAVTHWSVARNENVKWRTTLPEGGQSSVTIWGDKAFVTTHAPLESSAETATSTDILAYCLDAETGGILWTTELPGSQAVGTAGIFSDATVFAPISNGSHVWFFNRSGSIGCYDMDGNRVWLRQYTPRTRHTNRQCEPILVENQLLVVEVLDQQAAKKLRRHEPVPAGVDPRSVWTYIHGLDAHTGDLLWREPAATVIHNTPMVGRRANGEWAVLHARGGPHQPLEAPYGLSLTSLARGREGTVLWSAEFKDLNPMVNNHWNADGVFAFAGEDHVVLDPETGRERSRRSLRRNIDLWRHDVSSSSWKLERGVDLSGTKPRLITYHTNILVGDWHYFLAHERAAIGRVDTRNDRVEYLDVPVQLVVSPDGAPEWIWNAGEAVPIMPENSRGIRACYRLI